MYTEEEKEELEYLYKLYHEKDQAFEKAKGKRTRIAILGFTLGYLLLFYLIGKTALLPDDATLTDMVVLLLILIIPSFIVAFIHFWINLSVFSWLGARGREEYEELQSIKRKVNEIKNEPPMGFWYPDDDL